MTFGGWLWLLWRGLAARPGRAALLAVCAGLSGFAAALAFHVVFYLRGEVRPFVEELFPERRLVVSPRDVDVAFFRFQAGRLDAAAVERIRAMDGVAAAHPQAAVRFPISAEGGLGGITYASDIVVNGVPAELIAGDLRSLDDFAWAPGSGGPVPIAASSYFLDLYNMGLAESTGLPRLSRSAAIGRTFELILGESSIGLAQSEQRPRRVEARIVALTSDPNLIGLVAPLEAVEAWNREFAPQRAGAYTRLHLDAEDAAAVIALRDALEEEGFQVATAADRLRQARGLVAGTEAAALGALGVVLVLTLVGVGSTTAMAARERRPQWGLQRATGMAPGRLFALATGEALAVGLLAAAPAVGAALAVVLVARDAFSERLAEAVTIPGDPLAVDPWALAAAGALTLAVVVVPAWIAAAGALRKAPVRLIEERSL